MSSPIYLRGPGHIALVEYHIHEVCIHNTLLLLYLLIIPWQLFWCPLVGLELPEPSE